MWFMIFGDDKIFFSESATVGSTTTLDFGNQSTASSTVTEISGGYQSAGWYASSVPEPTSGLLLLLGMAGLALKRKIA